MKESNNDNLGGQILALILLSLLLTIMTCVNNKNGKYIEYKSKGYYEVHQR